MSPNELPRRKQWGIKRNIIYRPKGRGIHHSSASGGLKLKRQGEGTLPFEGFTLYKPQVLIRQILSELNITYKIPKVHITSAHPTNSQHLQIPALGTKPIKNKGSKKNGLVIGQATIDICFKYRYNIKIMMTVSGHTIL